MRVGDFGLLIQLFNGSKWVHATEHVVEGQTCIHAPAGTTYRIIVNSRSNKCKVVGCWVDGHRVISECRWLEAKQSIMIHGFPRNVGGTASAAADTIPFRLAPVVHSEHAARSILSDHLGTITVAVYDVVKCSTYDADFALTTVPLSSAATGPITSNVDSKTAVHRPAGAIRPSVGTVLPSAAEVGQSAMRYAVSWKLDASPPTILKIRYTDDPTVVTMSDPVDLTLTQSSVASSVVLTSPSQPQSGHKRGRGEATGNVVDVVDMCGVDGEIRDEQYQVFSVAVNTDALDWTMSSMLAPTSLSQCRPSVLAEVDPRLAELKLRACDAVRPRLAVGDAAVSLPVWSISGERLMNFEDAMRAREIIIGRHVDDEFLDHSVL